MLEARALSASLGGRGVLDGVTMTLSAGDFLAVAGPNGAGKTTLLRCLAGLVEPGMGQVLCYGKVVGSYTRLEYSRLVAYAPQSVTERYGFTAREAVLMGRHPWMPRFGRPGRKDLEAAEQAMEAMDVTGLADRPVTELSGGERRRVSLARTLAQAAGIEGSRPGAILLDEPVAGLDIRHALACMRVLAAKAASGWAVAVVLHDLSLAAMFCPATLVLDAGRVAAYGPTPDALTAETIAGVFGVRASVEAGCVRFLEE